MSILSHSSISLVEFSSDFSNKTYPMSPATNPKPAPVAVEANIPRSFLTMITESTMPSNTDPINIPVKYFIMLTLI